MALVDIELADGRTGIDLARQIRNRFDASLLYVTACSDADTIALAATTHPAAYVTKPFQESQLLSAVMIAVLQVQARRARVAPNEHSGNGLRDIRERQRGRIARAVADAEKPMSTPLSPRKLDVLRRLLANGRVVTIASDLNISPHTVRNHLRSTYRKLGVHSQVELIHKLTSASAADGA